ncbi:Hypothetical protein GLP15_4352 [Giardia lamblia P15]|uniref:Uncharacterized protein n=1 Tax=Giardia intestinalis (strain P15) TaxID=658858 RepID=E1F3J2_GIAIA|nr:Hypothetical protein GLP15_4352 [Giardia lamblia P15]
MEGTAPDVLLDKAAEYIEKLTDQVSQRQGEIERLELVVREQSILMDSMATRLKDNEIAESMDEGAFSNQQQKISDLETAIEVMTLDLESRSNSIATLFSQVTYLNAFITKLLNACLADLNSVHIIEDLRQLSAKANQLEASILEMGLPLSEYTEPAKQVSAVSESAIHIPLKPEGTQPHPTLEKTGSEGDELQYYKGRCAALEHQVTALREALLSQEELSRRIVTTAPSNQPMVSLATGRNALPPSFRQLALLEMLQLVNKELSKSPSIHLNTAFDPKLSASLKSVALGAPAAAQQLQRFPEMFVRLMSGV